MVASDDDDSSLGGHVSDSSSGLESMEDQQAVNPDTLEDFFHDDDDHWLTEEHLFELQTAKDATMKVPPALSNWNLREPTAEVDITVAKARRMAWEQAKAEIRLHKRNVEELPQAGSSAIDKVYQHMFGSKSRVCRHFQDKLGISHQEYLCFLVSYFKSCRYKTSVPNLHGSDDTFPLLMPREQYNGIWSSIVALSRPAHGQSFWQELEAVMNGVFSDLFMDSATNQMEGDEESAFLYQIGLDDDKVHYNWGKSTKSDGLKRGHHAKDNRHGFTAHTACNAATAAPLNVSFQRQNETVQSTTERMIDSMFGQHTGKVDRLDNVELGMDRGYWLAVLLFRLLDQGANVHGTLKRMDWVPLTFKHKGNTFPSQPLDIALEGFKDAYYMNTKWKGKQAAFRKVTCVGYRSGTGTAVALAISSQYRRVHWDLVPYGNVRWYHDKHLTEFERKSKALTLLVGEDPVNECRHLILDAVEPRTCEQGTADWFIDRQLSGTSSTIAELVIAVASLLVKDQEDESTVAAFETVLSYAGYKSDLVIGSKVKQPAPEEVVDAANSDSSEDSTDSEARDSKTEAAHWYSTLTDPIMDMDDEFKEEAKSMDRKVLSWIVALFKKKEYKLLTAVSARKTLIDSLLPYSKDRRAYALLTLTDLKKLADEKNIRATGLKKDALIDELITPATPATAGARKKKQQRTKEAMDDELLPLFTLFKQSYLRQQPGKEKAAARIGHRNEAPFLKSFFELCNGADEGNSSDYTFASLNPVAIFRLGLVRKKGSRFVKASLDGITVIRDEDDDLVLLPTEVKTRVSTATMNEARDRVADIVGAEHYNPRVKYLIRVPSSDALLRMLIHDEGNPNRKNSECFQLLHSAFAVGSTHGLLLVGSKEALQYAVKVEYEPTLLDAYAQVMDYIYNNLVKPFYESSVEDLKANETIEEVIKSIDYMDSHSFWTNYMLWRALNVDIKPTTCFPLPPCARCLPFQHAVWNQLKGPSDTTTKLLDSFEEQLGIRTPRTIATARLLSVGAVAFHRSNQMLSSKSTTEYGSLYGYRHAANNRFTMTQSLSVLLELAKADYEALRSLVAGPRVTFASLVQPPPNTPPRKTRAGEEAPQRVTWSYYAKTGCTPMRGRSANIRHKSREKQCDGRVLVAIINDPSKPGGESRQKCRLCGMKTNHYCTGCKNYLCFGTAQGLNEARLDAIAERDTEGLIKGTPKTVLKMSSYDPKTEEWIPSFAKNCCYLIHHQDAFDTLWATKHAKEGQADSDADDDSS